MKNSFILKVLIPLVLMGLFGCNEYQEGYTIEGRAAFQKQNIQELFYYKDSRTHLCFASYGIADRFGAMTNVPCTPEVERLVK